MNYWWVNQNKTHKAEIEGDYMWSPKKTKSGGTIQFYENMRIVKPGDKIFSYYGQKIQCIGEATSEAYSFNKPNEFGKDGIDWKDSGWKVDVKFKRLNEPKSIKEKMSEIVSLLPKKYSPLRADGSCNQAYLFYLPHELAKKLLKIVNENDDLSIQDPATALISWNTVNGAFEAVDKKTNEQIELSSGLDFVSVKQFNLFDSYIKNSGIDLDKGFSNFSHKYVDKDIFKMSVGFIFKRVVYGIITSKNGMLDLHSVIRLNLSGPCAKNWIHNNYLDNKQINVYQKYFHQHEKCYLPKYEVSNIQVKWWKEASKVREKIDLYLNHLKKADNFSIEYPEEILEVNRKLEI